MNMFKEQFLKTQKMKDLCILNHVSKLITKGKNEDMEIMPTEEEVKMVTFALNGDIASGPDDFSGKFFQSC